MKIVLLRTVVAVVVLTSFLSCGTTSSRTDTTPERGPSRRDTASSSSRGESGGGLWDMLAEERKRKEASVAANRERERKLRVQNERGRAQVPPEQRRQMETWWNWFIQDDDRWIQARHDWRALGDDATTILVENLLIAMVTAYDNNKGVYYKKARAELYELQDRSTPYLVAALSGQHGDDVVRNHCVELLGLIGKPALGPLTSSYRKAGVRARVDILRAVAEIGPEGRPGSTRFLARVVRDEDDFRPRLAAVQGLGKGRDSAAVPVLVECLRDGDLSVRKFAAASLGAFRSEDRVVDPLIACLAAAEKRFGAGERAEEVGENCVRSLRRITGQRYTRARDWQAWRSR